MRAGAAVALCALAVLAAGCGAGTGGVAAAGNAGNGERLFKEKCGSCHTLRAAGTGGKVGPDLDYAFGSDYSQGFKEETIRQVVADQIRFAGQYPPKGPTMPQNIVTGEAVDDVATYVAQVAGFRKSKSGTTGATTTQPAPATTGATTATGGGGAGSLAAGKKAFDDNGCGSCHTLQAAGASGTVGPDLDKLKSYAQKAGKSLQDFIHESIVDPNAYVEKGYSKGVMPTTFASLPPATLDALVKFLAASAKG